MEQKLTHQQEMEKVALIMKISNTYCLDDIKAIPGLLALRKQSELKKENK